MVIASFLIAAVLASQPPPTPDRVRRGYIQGSLLLSHHPASGATYHRVDPNLSGDVAAVSVAAGGFLSPTIALEGEFVYGRLVSAPQGFHYSFNIDYVAQNRDMLINELVRYRPEGKGRLQLVAGGGYARTTTKQVSQIETEFGANPNTLPDQTVMLNTFTLTGGIDVMVPVSPRVAVAPTVRVRWIHRPEPAASGWNGIGAYTFQVGIGVFVR